MSLAGRRRATGTSTYLGPRAFLTKDTARKNRAAQRTALPPRCAHCRLPGRILLDALDRDGVTVGVPHCDAHTLNCDRQCGLAPVEPDVQPTAPPAECAGLGLPTVPAWYGARDVAACPACHRRVKVAVGAATPAHETLVVRR